MTQVLTVEPVPVRQLQPGCPPDLETICHKCLHKEASNRYPTAAALADDLRRFREGEPIAARPPGLWRRFGRWREKHPGTTVALTIAAGLLLVALLLTLLFRNPVTVPAFVAVLWAFVRPSRKTLLISAATVLAVSLLGYLLVPNLFTFAVALGLGVFPAGFVGTAGRLTARVMKQDPLPTTIGAYYGVVAGFLLSCCGLVVVAWTVFRPENEQMLQELSQQQVSQWGVACVLTACVLTAWLVPTVLGAIAGGAAWGRKRSA
jgi:hypothetical protein